jgi:segregation and condensation protein B
MRGQLTPPLRGPLARRVTDRLPGDHPLPSAYRLLLEVGDATPRGPLARDVPLAMVEAVLLIADEPLPARRLAQAAGVADAGDARRLVRKLQALYDEDGSAFQVEELAGGYQLLTRSEYHRWLVRLRRGGLDVRLTPAARETLAIVAYRQAITRADVEVIRGVHCGEILRLLMEKGLIRIVGRHDSLGRPVLYGTTRKFLQVFGLKSVNDLPQAEGLTPPKEKSKDTKRGNGEPRTENGE